ncbi:BPTI/Kunitz domain-containing protein 4-like [Mytilus californianus]|uniref:BPTI/Kunitz domain-containing protein 4-like n=1 Tax=Mytilus californianus TaxID=6549 RepID=UPI0022478C0C|nr:BPTI/Kunitz domain-containing protein 4-like [Mytilus californianus]
MLQYFVYFILQIVVLQIHDIEGRSEPIRDPCYLPKKTGFCRAAFRRYFYDASTGKCKSFIYGGCRGNENNFKSVKECKRTCVNKDIVDPIRPIDCGPVCAIFCINGNVIDARGCPTCQCRSSPPVERRCPRNSRSNIGCPIMKNPECDRDRDCPRRGRCCTFGCSKRCINSYYKPPIRLH